MTLLAIQATRPANRQVDRVSPRLRYSNEIVAIIQVMQLPPVTKARKLNLDFYYKHYNSILDHLWCFNLISTHFYDFYIPEKIITLNFNWGWQNHNFISWEINFYDAQINNSKNSIINKWAALHVNILIN